MHIEIADISGVSGLMDLAGGLIQQTTSESDSGYEKDVVIGGRTVHEKYDARNKKGELSVILVKRFSVDVTGSGVDMHSLEQSLSQIDLAQLESMKDVGGAAKMNSSPRLSLLLLAACASLRELRKTTRRRPCLHIRGSTGIPLRDLGSQGRGSRRPAAGTDHACHGSGRRRSIVRLPDHRVFGHHGQRTAGARPGLAGRMVGRQDVVGGDAAARRRRRGRLAGHAARDHCAERTICSATFSCAASATTSRSRADALPSALGALCNRIFASHQVN